MKRYLQTNLDLIISTKLVDTTGWLTIHKNLDLIISTKLVDDYTTAQIAAEFRPYNFY